MKLRFCVVMILLVLAAPAVTAQYKLYEEGLAKYEAKNYTESIRLLSDFLGRALHDKKFDADAYYCRALSYFKTEKYQESINDFQETILLNHANKGNIYWFMAKAEAKLLTYPEAINDYTNALKEITDAGPRAKLYYERSQLYNKAGNLILALEDLNSASILSPGDKEIKHALDQLNSQTASSRMVSSKEKDNTAKKETIKPEIKTPVTTPEVKQSVPVTDPNAGTSIAANEKKAGNDKKKQPEVVKEKEKEKPAETQPVVTTPVVTTPVAPPAPTLADLYKDERRFALVIGNSRYSKAVGLLKNPVNDATDIAKELRASNFDVTLLTDATYGQMRANMLKFKEKVDAGDRDKTVALFYYAGHGIQHEDENFLVPVDASLEYADDIARYCFPIQKMVLSNMERSNARMNIVILDACRNNPFPSLTRSVGAQGLGEMKRARGSFIAYATAPGSVAADGDGRNGLYTQELLKAMRKPGLTIEQVFKEVRLNVLRHSGDRQNTWDSSNIVGDFYFKF